MSKAVKYALAGAGIVAAMVPIVLAIVLGAQKAAEPPRPCKDAVLKEVWGNSRNVCHHDDHELLHEHGAWVCRCPGGEP